VLRRKIVYSKNDGVKVDKPWQVLHSYSVFSVRKIGRVTEQNSKIAGGKIGHFWRRLGIKAYWASQLVLSCALGVEKSKQLAIP